LKRSVKISLLVAGGILIVGAAVPVVTFFYIGGSQYLAGRKYMDSLTEADIQTWIDRTKVYLTEYDPTRAGFSGNGYGIGYAKPVPADLERIKILRIDILQDSVKYVWLGGLDHTWLVVTRLSNTNFKVVARYSDEHSRVIREGKDANISLELTLPTAPSQ
jgi:hypothetical protein